MANIATTAVTASRPLGDNEWHVQKSGNDERAREQAIRVPALNKTRGIKDMGYVKLTRPHQPDKYLYGCVRCDGNQPDQVELNATQRQLLGAEVGDVVLYEPVRAKDIAAVKRIVFHVEWNKEEKQKVGELQLAELMRPYVLAQVLHRGQELVYPRDLVFEREANPRRKALKCTVEYIEGDKPEQELEYGRWSEQTECVFSGDCIRPNRLLKISDVSFESIGVGGMTAQFEELFQKCFLMRAIPKHVYARMGLTHVKGVLLYGPAGTGKTRIARSLSTILNCEPPKIVNGAELFNKFVGESERQVRELFAPAEANPDKLYMIVFDEFDAMARQRGGSSSSTGVGDSVVNQLLSKIDGVNPINNVILVGLTNRIDLIDKAILRPGRFEVHIEIGLPDEAGRREIFLIHTAEMRKNKIIEEDKWDVHELSRLSENMTGAEIESCVKNATTSALRELVDLNHLSASVAATEHVHITMDHFRHALAAIVPAFGARSQQLSRILHCPSSELSKEYADQVLELDDEIAQFRANPDRHLLNVLITGSVRSGKTYLAAHTAKQLGFRFTQYLCANDLVSATEAERMNRITQLFYDAQKCEESCVIVDDVDLLTQYTPPNYFSNAMFQLFKTLLGTQVVRGKMIVILCSNYYEDLCEKNVFDRIHTTVTLPPQGAS